VISVFISWRPGSREIPDRRQDRILVFGDGALACRQNARRFVRIPEVDGMVELDADRDDFVMMRLNRQVHLGVNERAHGVVNVMAKAISEAAWAAGATLVKIERDNHVHPAFDSFGHRHGRAVDAVAQPAAFNLDRRQQGEKRAGSINRLPRQPATQDQAFAGFDVGRLDDGLRAQVFQPRLAKRPAQEIFQPLRLEQAGRIIEAFPPRAGESRHRAQVYFREELAVEEHVE
jgi:hypothetical protein